MGTNYYLNTNVCECCGRHREQIHIGKSSMGWPFLFRGYRKWPPDGVPHPITSGAEWRAFLDVAVTQKGRVVDEYGKPQDVGELFDLIASKQGQTAGPASCSYTHGSRESEWLDAGGYRFCDSEFS